MSLSYKSQVMKVSKRGQAQRINPILLCLVIPLVAASCREDMSQSKSEKRSAIASTKQSSAVETPAMKFRDISPSELSVFVIHQVSQPEAFLAEFKSNDGARKQAGVRSFSVSREVAGEKRFIVQYLLESKAQLDVFLSSKEYENLLQESQAVDSSLMWEVSNVFSFVGSESLSGKYSLIKKFRVKKFELLKMSLKAQARALAKEGALGVSLHRTTVDSEVAALHLIAKDEATLHRLYDGALLQGICADASCENMKSPLIARHIP